MNARENLLSLYRRTGYNYMPVEFDLCPSLETEYKKRTNSKLGYEEYFDMPFRRVGDLTPADTNTDRFLKYHTPDLKPGTTIDDFGLAHEPGSEAAKHMTYLRSPLRGVDSFDVIKEYPYPDFTKCDASFQKAEADAIHAKGHVALGSCTCTIWEFSWYLRGMEDLMMDMMSDDPIAEFILDKVTEINLHRASSFVHAGCDIINLGDDIGMQSRIMMSEELYVEWLKPRLKRFITTLKAINPNVLIMYHSCGYVKPLIGHLIDAGIDILNPVQPECMSFEEIHSEYGGALSFNGTIGTQSVMPFGTPEEVRENVFKNLDIAGKRGGLMVCPTHMLEPEVPWKNIIAYVEACKEYMG